MVNEDYFENTDIKLEEFMDLTKTVKENMCPVWHERKQAQAKMRLHIIKKLLKKLVVCI